MDAEDDVDGEGETNTLFTTEEEEAIFDGRCLAAATDDDDDDDDGDDAVVEVVGAQAIFRGVAYSFVRASETWCADTTCLPLFALSVIVVPARLPFKTLSGVEEEGGDDNIAVGNLKLGLDVLADTFSSTTVSGSDDGAPGTLA